MLLFNVNCCCAGQNSSSLLPDTDPSGHTVSAQPVLSSATPVAASSTAGCPNKRNPYHQCSEYCEKRWGEKLNAGENSEPELILPPEWTQITDEKMCVVSCRVVFCCVVLCCVVLQCVVMCGDLPRCVQCAELIGCLSACRICLHSV